MKAIKYKAIGKFAKAVGLSRSGAFKALEANDAQAWGQYAAFLEQRNRRQLTALEDAKARVSNVVRSSKLAEALNIEYRKKEQDRIYGPEYETFTK